MTRSSARDDWRRVFVAEARRRRLPRAEIGAALAEVDAYCAEPGTDPTDAFGEPTEYAVALADGYRAAEPESAVRSPWLGAFVAASTLVGVMALLAGVEATTGDGSGALTVGQVVSALAGVAGIVLVAAWLFWPARAYRPTPDWRFGLVGAAAIAVTTVPVLVWQQVAVRVPGWLLLGAGLLLLLAAWWPLASGRLLADRAPARATDAGSSAPAPGWRTRTVRWGLPVALLCVVAIAVLLDATGTS
ncbi:DUF1129 domain-containing protein [Plantactinospora endophytica]|uniref:DUF1707 domain-containing protein n=1 Tax=Plantactinospora endophytica TaxID=673535 RepID=A0ABQ4DVC8_9ACTN|nr:hypothetical protein [Plantactinospora endophytica]GIG86389.1 hypothetical protein Pen02_13250 [Plantactinospora endophytica]